MLRNSSTYIYLAVALGLVCYLAFIDKKIPGTKEREESKSELFKFDQNDVTGLEINNVHGVFIFQKNNNHWEIKKPVNTLADNATMEQIVTQIADTQPQRVIPIDASDKGAEGTLKEWGLLPPAERVVIHTKNKTYELLVGRKMAINESVYARASGRKNEDVRILPISIKNILQKDLSDFRSRNVFDFEADKVTKVASQTANMGTTPAQECEIDLKDKKWTLQKPLVARASETDVQAMLGKIMAQRVVDFVTDDASNLSQYGLTSPGATLTVTLKPEEDLVLQIGSPVPDKPDQLYARRLKSNSVFTLTKSSVNDLLKALPNVRDRHVFSFNPGKPTRLTYSFGAKKADVRFDNGLWNTVGDAEGRADIGKLNDLLPKLSQLETTPLLKDSATDLKPFGLDKPQGKITIQSTEFKPEPTLTLFIGKVENKLLYVRNSAEPFIYTVPDNAFDFLPPSNLALRDARAINLSLKQVKSMTIVSGSSTPIVLTRSSGGTWTASNVKDRIVDSVKADTQASLFCQLQAKTWLGPVQPSYGLGKPILTISVQADQSTPTVLHIGAVLPDGGHAAQVEGNSTAFEISDGDYGILNASSLQLMPSGLPATNAPAAAPSANAAPDKK